jgi:hypothetical protein
VEVDPGPGVTWLDGRLYVNIKVLVAEDVVNSIRTGQPPVSCLVPHGTQHEFMRWQFESLRTYDEGLRKLDELQPKSEEKARQWKERQRQRAAKPRGGP